tara:strand:- start:193 stop:621 length:429 start_codon:yes stop_codon:yes gene_type:complete
MSKLIIYISILFIISNCSNKITYSGKILNEETLKDINFTNKEKLIGKLGYPSYVDEVQNKLFYFSETSEKKSIFNKKVKYSYVFVFKIDENEKIVETKVYNIKNVKNIKIANEKTPNEIVKRGILEKVFGGVGTQQEIPTTP